MGVWIETSKSPTRASRCAVTPYVGVWIETMIYFLKVSVSEVTPYVGVWIETAGGQHVRCIARSLLMWECGLKQFLV